ncbi:MAG: hypothetical protein ACRDRK_21930 [Pseudonocardia sp.]
MLRYAHDDASAPGCELPDAERVDAAVASFRMLADPTRLRLMWLLCAAEHDVTDLAAAVGAAVPPCRSTWRSCGSPGW